MASWKKILTEDPAMADLGSGTASSSTFLRGDGTWNTPSSGSNYYLTGVTKATNTLTFAVSGASDPTYEFGSNAFTSTAIPTGALASLNTVAAATITDDSVGADELNVSGDGTSGYVLTSDGDGTFSWSAKTTNTDVQWTGVSTNLVANTGLNSLGGTTIGKNVFKLTNPGAVTFLRMNADNTATALGKSDYRTAIGAGTSSLAVGTTGGTALEGDTVVTNVGKDYLESALALIDTNVTIGSTASIDTTISGDLTVTGDLLVSGDTVTVNVATLDVEDHIIKVARGAANAGAGTASGIEVETANVTMLPSILWKNSGAAGTQWNMYHEGDTSAIPIAGIQTEGTSGTPSGPDTWGGAFCYNSADGTLYFYDAS